MLDSNLIQLRTNQTYPLRLYPQQRRFTKKQSQYKNARQQAQQQLFTKRLQQLTTSAGRVLLSTSHSHPDHKGV